MIEEENHYADVKSVRIISKVIRCFFSSENQRLPARRNRIILSIFETNRFFRGSRIERDRFWHVTTGDCDCCRMASGADEQTQFLRWPTKLTTESFVVVLSTKSSPACGDVSAATDRQSTNEIADKFLPTAARLSRYRRGTRRRQAPRAITSRNTARVSVRRWYDVPSCLSPVGHWCVTVYMAARRIRHVHKAEIRNTVRV